MNGTAATLPHSRRRESTRSEGKALVPPPWRLVSPTGVIHVVRDEAALKALAIVYPELIVDRRNVLRGNWSASAE